MTQAQAQMEERQNNNPEQEAVPAADCESCELLRNSSDGRARPEPTVPASKTSAPRCPGRDRCAAIARHRPDCPRAMAARQLARQTESEARRFAELAASLNADLRLTRARQRVGWTYTPEADGEGPG
ncbi:MAG: hypothetical protein ABSD48_06640 [Armatimonadota bacterium]|jgi:hypothetical protein